MEMQERVKAINNVLRAYFADKTNPRQVPALKLMGLFINKGIFNKDHRNGLPIRKILRKLNNEGRLHDIPYAHGDLKQKNIYWTFVDVNADMDVNTSLSKGLVDVSNGASVGKKGSSRANYRSGEKETCGVYPLISRSLKSAFSRLCRLRAAFHFTLFSKALTNRLGFKLLCSVPTWVLMQSRRKRKT